MARKKQVYVVRTYVLATSPSHAARLAKKSQPVDIFLDDTATRLMVEQMVGEQGKKAGYGKRG